MINVARRKQGLEKLDVDPVALQVRARAPSPHCTAARLTAVPDDVPHAARLGCELGGARGADPDRHAPVQRAAAVREAEVRAPPPSLRSELPMRACCARRDLTRGHRVDRARMRAFVEGLDIPAAAKAELLALTPSSYVGLAAQLAREV